MARYRFHSPLESSTQEVDLADDQAAWSEAVTYVGELLRGVDGALEGDAHWDVTVYQGERQVIHIEVSAKRC